MYLLHELDVVNFKKLESGIISSVQLYETASLVQ